MGRQRSYVGLAECEVKVSERRTGLSMSGPPAQCGRKPCLWGMRGETCRKGPLYWARVDSLQRSVFNSSTCTSRSQQE